MGKYREHRQSRSQGLESDNHHESWEPSYFDRRPAPPQQPSSATTFLHDAEVLWLNAEKGFGFLRLSDGSDAFIHLSKLQAAGHDSLPEGARLKVRTEPGQKGAQVVEVVSVSIGDGASSPKVANRSAEVSVPVQEQEGREAAGFVKRYDLNKGFGFIALDGGGKDVFVHATTLTRSGVDNLDVGQKVIITYNRGHKGLEARTIRLC
ncbi:cold-shock protein [Mesorhizobium carmichaelinearum]|uniref:cold-shock protein n=1 Tax=Mesorhizobium carmichaelinearum TaxID=1208188 RepID=UPI000BA39512|nr:cold shock domain-containing protein [Mesorhizobium carmichaelinearum]